MLLILKRNVLNMKRKSLKPEVLIIITGYNKARALREVVDNAGL